jgi:hypothetical protein
MKRMAILALAICLVGALAILPACGSGGSGTGPGTDSGTGSGSGGGQADVLTGTVPELLTQLHDLANDQLVGDDALPETFDDPVTAENCQGVMGLTPDELSEFVDEAYVQTAAISVDAHGIVLAKCKSPEAAATVAKRIAANYDSGRWICVFPDTSWVVTSGSYVLLASTSSERSMALQRAFSEMTEGSVGEINAFYAKEGTLPGIALG